MSYSPSKIFKYFIFMKIYYDRNGRDGRERGSVLRGLPGGFSVETAFAGKVRSETVTVPFLKRHRGFRA